MFWLQNVVKCRKYSPAKFSNFVLICITQNAPHLGRKWCVFRAKYKLIQNFQISQGYIFRILQHFATKLCNFTNFNMLFVAVVMDFVLLA
jgi:hypothetical protein